MDKMKHEQLHVQNWLSFVCLFSQRLCFVFFSIFFFWVALQHSFACEERDFIQFELNLGSLNCCYFFCFVAIFMFVSFRFVVVFCCCTVRHSPKIDDEIVQLFVLFNIVHLLLVFAMWHEIEVETFLWPFGFVFVWVCPCMCHINCCSSRPFEWRAGL